VSRSPDRSEIDGVIEEVVREARAYLAGLDERPMRARDSDAAADRFDGGLPEEGHGASAALARLFTDGLGATTATTGPRSYHFVTGGVTPAALGADWLATVLDQNAYAWVSSPLGVKLEEVSLGWLKDLFGLPASWGGVFTTGASMSNYVGLSAARQWWSEQHGVDVSEEGFDGLPPVPVLSSGYVHASAVKCCGMLGMGRNRVQKFARDEYGRIDLEAMEKALRALDGAPAIMIANAGEVNAGDFDPIEDMADLAEKYNAWLHVDGAFGLFAALDGRIAHLTRGVARARSVGVDGHKWLNVPYDCGFSFVDDRSLLQKAFAYTAHYLPGQGESRPVPGGIGPESSRRSRSLAVWATLYAYGRRGHQEVVERHMDLAQHLAGLVDRADDLERLADVPLNIVCFRYNPGGLDEEALNALNDALGAAIIADGRVYAGTTKYGSRTALRPALVNWRIREEDIELFVDVVRELGARVAKR